MRPLLESIKQLTLANSITDNVRKQRGLNKSTKSLPNFNNVNTMVAVSDLGKVIASDGSQLTLFGTLAALSLLLLKHKHKPRGALSSYLVPSTAIIIATPVASSTTTVVIAVASTTCETRGDKHFSISENKNGDRGKSNSRRRANTQGMLER